MKNNIPEELLKERKIPREVDVRGHYFRDQTAIIHSMPFRRLKHKTQVFFSPTNDHVCTRIEHVLHVATIAATICKGLNKHGSGNWELDFELAYAIGLGHDLGHAPFGHAGEVALSKCLGKPFIHEINSLRVVDVLSAHGEGLNLTYAVRDGIICHNGENFEKSLEPASIPNILEEIVDRKIKPSTIEGCIVRFADKIAYLGRDVEDAILAKIILEDDVPEKVRNILGKKNGEIINTLVIDLINSTLEKNILSFSDEKFEIINELKNFNYNKIYKDEELLDYINFVENILVRIFEYLKTLFCKHGFDFEAYKNEHIEFAQSFGRYLEKMEKIYHHEKNVPNQILSDYISGMTDAYAIEVMKMISLPKPIKFL
jgi:dGTPase